MSKSITLRELIECEFSINEKEEMVGEIPLERINEIADVIINQQEKINKAIEILNDTSVDMPSTLLIETIDYARHILGDKENENNRYIK